MSKDDDIPEVEAKKPLTKEDLLPKEEWELPIHVGLRHATQSLFYEYRHKTTSKIQAPYTLKNYDVNLDGTVHADELVGLNLGYPQVGRERYVAWRRYRHGQHRHEHRRHCGCGRRRRKDSATDWPAILARVALARVRDLEACAGDLKALAAELRS